MSLDPGTLAAVAAVTGIIGTGVSVIGVVQQGKALEAQGKYQAAVARNNQVIQERAAEDVLKRGKAEVALRRRQVLQLIGAQRAAFAGAGIEVNTGTAATTLEDTAASGAYEEAVIQADAERAAYEYRTRGVNFGAQAELDLARGEAARSASFGEAFSTVLSGASAAAQNYGTYKLLSKRA